VGILAGSTGSGLVVTKLSQLILSSRITETPTLRLFGVIQHRSAGGIGLHFRSHGQCFGGELKVVICVFSGRK
jgi:hypothetical protein